MNLLADFRFALRSLARVKGLALTVVATLALGCDDAPRGGEVARGEDLADLALGRMAAG